MAPTIMAQLSAHRLECVLGAVAGVVIVVAVLRARHSPEESADVAVQSINLIALIVWPIVFRHIVVRPKQGTLNTCPTSLLLPGSLWVFGHWAINAVLSHSIRRRPPTPHETEQADRTKPPIVVDPSSLTALAFGLSAIVGSRPDSRFSYLFTLSIVTCFLVVLPRHSLPPQSIEAIVYEAIQRNVLHYCIAAIITAVILTRHCLKNGSDTQHSVPVVVSTSDVGGSNAPP